MQHDAHNHLLAKVWAFILTGAAAGLSVDEMAQIDWILGTVLQIVSILSFAIGIALGLIKLYREFKGKKKEK